MRLKLLTQSCMICNMAFLFYFFCITEHLYLKITDTHWKYSLTANFFCFWYLTGVKKLQRTRCILKIRRLYTVHLLIWREGCKGRLWSASLRTAVERSRLAGQGRKAIMLLQERGRMRYECSWVQVILLQKPLISPPQNFCLDLH